MGRYWMTDMRTKLSSWWAITHQVETGEVASIVLSRQAVWCPSYSDGLVMPGRARARLYSARWMP